MQALLTHTQPGNSVQVGPPFSPRHADKRMAKPRFKPSASRPRFAVSETLGYASPLGHPATSGVLGGRCRCSALRPGFPRLQVSSVVSTFRGALALLQGAVQPAWTPGPCRSPEKETAAGERPKCMMPALSDSPGGHGLRWVRTPAIRESTGKGKLLETRVRP